MVEGKMKSLKLVGEGSSPGGEFEKIKVTGVGKVNGDVTSKRGKIIGECMVLGDAMIEQFQLTGNGKIEGELCSNEITVTGDLNVHRSIKANNVQMKGYLMSNGNVEIERMKVRGGFKINGLLNVGELMVNLHFASSKVQEIGGESITIKRRALFHNFCTLESDVIEGDNLYLEHTTANVVRGNHIELGPGCQIELVEYRSTYKCKQKDSKEIVDVKQI